MKPFVAIVVLNWNGLKDTGECIESLLRLDYPNCRIVLVDNASTDDSVTFLRNRYPTLNLIVNANNLGYSEGNNVGIRYALSQGADYVWLLNNDTVVDSFALNALLEVAENNADIGILGSKIYYFDEPDVLWFAGGPIDWRNMETPHVGHHERDCGQYDEIKEYDRVTGCSMMVSRKMCEKVGLLDPAFFLYVEEVDWCLRARANGFRVVYVPGSKVYHKESKAVQSLDAGTNVFPYYKTRNFLYMLKKNFRGPSSYLLMLRLLAKMIQRERSQRKSLAPVFIGAIDFVFGRMGEMKRIL